MSGSRRLHDDNGPRTRQAFRTARSCAIVILRDRRLSTLRRLGREFDYEHSVVGWPSPREVRAPSENDGIRGKLRSNVFAGQDHNRLADQERRAGTQRAYKAEVGGSRPSTPTAKPRTSVARRASMLGPAWRSRRCWLLAADRRWRQHPQEHAGGQGGGGDEHQVHLRDGAVGARELELATVLVFRAITFMIPPIFGFFTLRWLRAQGYA